MGHPQLRPIRDADWPAILELANESVAHVPGAGSQETWHDNRRHFDSKTGIQHQFVAEDPQSGAVLGYAAVESNLPGEFRLFLVMLPGYLDSLAELLYERCVELLREHDVRRVWFTEYGADEPLLSFARAHGFEEARRFSLPNGPEAVTLVKEVVD